VGFRRDDALNLAPFVLLPHETGYDSDNGNTTISIDTGGNGGSFESSQQIVLAGIDLTSGGTLSDQQILDNLFANGNLIVDQ